MSPVVPPAGAIPPASGGEWSIGALGGAAEPGPEAAPGSEGGFGSMLGEAVSGLEAKQEAAATQATELATGQSEDIAGVVAAVEEASLSMHLAAQLRNKAVEAYTEIFRTQV